MQSSSKESSRFTTQKKRSMSEPNIREMPSQANTSTEEKQSRRSISFGSVEIRSYAVVRGHPEIEMAYPLSLDWECIKKTQSDVDTYESKRLPKRVRHYTELRTDAEERRRILQNSERIISRCSRNRNLPSFVRILLRCW